MRCYIKKNVMRFLCLLFLNIFCFQALHTQVPFTIQNQENQLEEGLYFGRHQLFGLSSHSLQKYTHNKINPSQGPYTKLENEALLSSQTMDLMLLLPQAPNQLNYTINNLSPDPVTIPAILALGGYYYNQRAYKLCVETYEKTDLSELPFSDQVEPRFRKGYCHFVMKEFAEAKTELLSIKKDIGYYYFHTQYYLGLCEYFLGNYDDAVTYFLAAEQTPSYKPYVPYYICQIYLHQNKKEELISYGEKALLTPDVKNYADIRWLLGKAYYADNQYDKALPHFEYYGQNHSSYTVEEFFQIGVTYYKTKNYSQAIPNFDAIHREENQIGQLANYYLADCYLQSGQNEEARIAFKHVSQMDFIPAMKAEAAFNYAKLTASSGLEREALNALENIEESSPFYQESREILADVLEKSSDLQQALTVLERQKTYTNRLKKIYQIKYIQAGHKAFGDKNYSSAEQYYGKSQKFTVDRNAEVEALFWQGQSKQNLDQYDASILTFQNYFLMAKNQSLPVEYSPFLAHYAQGYNYLKKLNYKKALENYQEVTTIYKKNQLQSNPWKKIAGDAGVRAGDCAFKLKQFPLALSQYQNVIDSKWEPADYAMLHKGILLGLTGEPYEKILTLKDMTVKYKNSPLLDQAFMLIADTYNDLQSKDNAYTYYQNVIRQFGKTSKLANEARIKSGLIAYNKGDLNAAIKHYKDVLQSNPSPQEVQSALTGLEEIYINDLGKPDEYVKVLEKLPGYKPSSYSTDSLHYKVGEVRYENGDYEKAIEAFTGYLQKFGSGYYKTQATYYRGESYALLKKYDKALEDYVAVLQWQNHSFTESALKKAALITYNHTGDYKKAFDYYRQYYNLTEVKEEKIWAASGAMRSAFKNSDLKGTLQFGDIMLAENQAANEEKVAAAFYIGKLSYIQKNYDQALLYFSKIGKDVSSSQAAESRFWIADILVKKEKWDEAESQCNSANELNKSYPYWIARTVLIQADIYMYRADLYSARAAIEAVLENFSDDAGLVSIAYEKMKTLENLEKNNNKIKPKSDNLLRLDDRK